MQTIALANTGAVKPSNPVLACLNCPKPAKTLSAGRVPVFCSAKCREKWTRGINAWNRRLAATALDQQQPDMV